MPRKIVDLMRELEEHEKKTHEEFQRLINFLREHKDEAFTFQELEDILGFDVVDFLKQNLYRLELAEYYQKIRIISVNNTKYIHYHERLITRLLQKLNVPSVNNTKYIHYHER